MKLYYYKDEVGNFGDDLNPWLWDRLLPGFFDDNDSDLMIGIGTLLNHKIPTVGKKHVFGSGYGYGSLPRVDESYNFICVRGPKTAQALNLPASLALTDTAILIKSIEQPKANKTYKFGFIPHHSSIGNFSWDKLSAELGFNFINPCWSVDKVLAELHKCEVVLCEAMHGAIVCDALRIPWIPVKCYNYISDFKWEDWLLTVDMAYKPVLIPSLFDIDTRLPSSTRYKNQLKRTLKNLGLGKKAWANPHEPDSPQKLIDKASQLLKLASTSTIYLSSEAKSDSLWRQCVEKLEVLKNIQRSGMNSPGFRGGSNP